MIFHVPRRPAVAVVVLTRVGKEPLAGIDTRTIDFCRGRRRRLRRDCGETAERTEQDSRADRDVLLHLSLRASDTVVAAGPGRAHATNCAGMLAVRPPAAMTMYCLPLCMYVIGRPDVDPAGTCVSQRISPVALSIARNIGEPPHPSPTSNIVFVTRMEERQLPPVFGMFRSLSIGWFLIAGGVSPLAFCQTMSPLFMSVSYTHLRAHETRHDLVCR